MSEASASLEKRFDLTMVGETNLDLILYGLPEQMPTDRELLASGFTTTLGGSSSILAHNLGLLGTRVGFVTTIGDDPLGEIAHRMLAHSPVELSQLTRRPGEATGVTLLLPHGMRRHILTHLGVMAQPQVGELDLDYLRDARHFHLSSLFLQTGLHAGLPALFRALKGAGMTLSLDTNDDPEDRWGGVLPELLELVDVLLPNVDELLRIAGEPTLEAALEVMSARVPLLVVKCGRQGAIVQQGSERTTVPPLLVEPVDTIGAGDSFNAGFLHTWLRGGTPAASAAFGNVTGALSTLRAGGVEAFRDVAMRTEFFRRHAGQTAQSLELS